jgi:hypothetical protein
MLECRPACHYTVNPHHPDSSCVLSLRVHSITGRALRYRYRTFRCPGSFSYDKKSRLALFLVIYIRYSTIQYTGTT